MQVLEGLSIACALVCLELALMHQTCCADDHEFTNNPVRCNFELDQQRLSWPALHGMLMSPALCSDVERLRLHHMSALQPP